MNQMGEEYYPEAIGGTIRRAAQVAGVPIYVTENGVASEDDSRRVEYLQRAVRSVAEAMAAGIDVRGYLAGPLWIILNGSAAIGPSSAWWQSIAQPRCAPPNQVPSGSAKQREKTKFRFDTRFRCVKPSALPRDDTCQCHRQWGQGPSGLIGPFFHCCFFALLHHHHNQAIANRTRQPITVMMIQRY